MADTFFTDFVFTVRKAGCMMVLRKETQTVIINDARKSSSKRFCKPHRMMLIQGDIKYGPRLPIGKNGAMVQTYLSSAMDDHSRFLCKTFHPNRTCTCGEWEIQGKN